MKQNNSKEFGSKREYGFKKKVIASLPFSNAVTDGRVINYISKKAASNKFPMVRTIKYAAHCQETLDFIDEYEDKLFSISNSGIDNYAFMLMVCLNASQIVLHIDKDKLSKSDYDAISDSIDDMFGVDINEDSAEFMDVLKYLAKVSSFIPVIVYLNETKTSDIYWKSLIRLIISSSISLPYGLIKNIITDILDKDPEHMDALKFRESIIDNPDYAQYPPKDDVYYFIKWNSGNELYYIRRDEIKSPKKTAAPKPKNTSKPAHYKKHYNDNK